MKDVRAARWTKDHDLEVAGIDVADPGEGQVQVAVQNVG